MPLDVLGIKFITGDGKTITAGAKTTKSVVGYDFTRLVIGAEGTLGIITEATLKLLPHLMPMFLNLKKAWKIFWTWNNSP